MLKSEMSERIDNLVEENENLRDRIDEIVSEKRRVLNDLEEAKKELEGLKFLRREVEKFEFSLHAMVQAHCEHYLDDDIEAKETIIHPLGKYIIYLKNQMQHALANNPKQNFRLRY